MTIATRRDQRMPGRPLRPIKGFAALVALVITLATPGLVFAWGDNSFSSADEALLAQLTNQARASAGLNSLSLDATLTNVAEWRSKDMIDRNYFSHSIPPSGTKVFDELKRIGYCYVAAGENLGTNNFPDDIATQTLQDGFMASSGHRANILGAWTVMGIGAYKGADGKHMWTVLFATKCSSVPAATPKPTPKPTPTAPPTPTPTRAPAPTPTPAPTRAPTPKPTPAPTLAPTPTPTLPAQSTDLAATVNPTVNPTAEAPPATARPIDRDPSEVLGALGSRTRGLLGGFPEPTASPGPTSALKPAPGDDGGRSAGLQVTDVPFAGKLVDAIVGGVAGAYFGH